MVKDRDIGILLGILVGAFFAYLILKKSQPTTLSTQPQNIQPQYPQQFLNPNQQIQPIPIQPIPTVESILEEQKKQQNITSQLTSQIQKMTSQLEQTNLYLQQTASQLKQQPIIIQQPNTVPQTLQPIIIQQSEPKQQTQPIQQTIQPQTDFKQQTQEQQIYKNNEKWAIIRGQDGRIKSLEIIRNVKKNNLNG